MTQHEPPEGYEGGVTVIVDGAAPRTARAALAAPFDPLAGRVVWSGRVAARLAPRTTVEVATPHGTARAEATRPTPGATRG